MGDPGVHDDDHTAQFPVRLRGQPDGAGNDRKVAEPFPFPEDALLCVDVCAADAVHSQCRVLCRADRRRSFLCAFHRGLFLCLQKIPERQRTFDGDQGLINFKI